MRHNKLIYSIVAFACLIMLCMGCECKWPNNGDFDGMWQLMSIEQDGTVTSLQETKHYWSVRTNLIQYSEYSNSTHKFCHFERKDGQLILTDFCHESKQASKTDDDEWIKYDERSILEPWGIYAQMDTIHTNRLTETFTIEYLDNDCLILSTSTYKLQFRKF